MLPGTVTNSLQRMYKTTFDQSPKDKDKDKGNVIVSQVTNL